MFYSKGLQGIRIEKRPKESVIVDVFPGSCHRAKRDRGLDAVSGGFSGFPLLGHRGRSREHGPTRPEDGPKVDQAKHTSVWGKPKIYHTVFR